jgi:hypothetical protein
MEEVDKGEWWGGWNQVWYSWFTVRTFVDSTVYPHIAQQLKKLWKSENVLKHWKIKTWTFLDEHKVKLSKIDLLKEVQSKNKWQ